MLFKYFKMNLQSKQEVEFLFVHLLNSHVCDKPDNLFETLLPYTVRYQGLNWEF